MPHFMIVVSPYYKDIAENLLQGTKTLLDEKQATYEVFEVFGALEIPLAIQYGIKSLERFFDGYIALGCVIRGETSHYDIVCNESARGLSQLSLAYDMPVGNGILTCDSMAQAIVRADPAQKNKGRDAALAAVSMYELKQTLAV